MAVTESDLIKSNQYLWNIAPVFSFIEELGTSKYWYASLGHNKLSVTDQAQTKSEYLSYGHFIKKLGINSMVMDINTSEVDKYWRNFASLMINDDFLISQSIEPFKAFDEIAEMYYKVEDSVVDFFVLLDNEEYDFELMHKIFAIERMIKKMWDGKYLDFHYGPEKFIDKIALRRYHIAYKRG